jgi:hypothetical protein
MAIAERETLALEGVIVVAVDVIRPKAAMSSGGGWAGATGGGGAGANAAGGLSCKARLTTRAMWTDQGKLLDTLHQVGRVEWWYCVAGFDEQCFGPARLLKAELTMLGKQEAGL